jgi:UV DNA damage endonuclease
MILAECFHVPIQPVAPIQRDSSDRNDAPELGVLAVYRQNMRIGYPCINRSLSCRPSRTFRLRSYSTERFKHTVENNLACMDAILDFNIAHGMLFLRITSDLIPFASHPVCTFPWQKHFAPDLRRLGKKIKQAGMRISMHPDQFILINSPRKDVFRRSVEELRYHATVLDLMELDLTARIQIHVGGVYADKPKSLDRFVRRYKGLPRASKRRLAVENDDRLFTLSDCMWIHERTRLPVIFDTLHHAVNGAGQSLSTALEAAFSTWSVQKGRPMLDYSDQDPTPGARSGKHARTLDRKAFRRFLQTARAHDFDVMLEIKDKERSAAAALAVARTVDGIRLNEGATS